MQRAVAVARHLAAAEASKSAGEAPRALGVGECAEKAQLAPRSLGAATLRAERARASFDAHELACFLAGSAETLALRERLTRELENDPVFKEAERDVELPWHEQRGVTMARMNRLLEYQKSDSPAVFRERSAVAMLFDYAMGTRLFAHFGLFGGTVLRQSTDEQLQRFKSLVDGGSGCFAMTELGHGSFVRGFETTATLDAAADQWVLHSPTLTARKWWIAGAAETALHAVVYARTLVSGVDHGVNVFLVPLRDATTFRCLPGVTCGDVGQKMGRNGVDNGFIVFDSMRVPRESLLMRYIQVARDGTVTRSPGAEALSYGALVDGRVNIVRGAASALKIAATIAVRYGLVRRQFPSPAARSGESEECVLLDYASHQRRLMPIVADALATHFTADAMDALNASNHERLQQGDVSLLPALHAASAGLKAHATWRCCEALEEARQSCGGSGYHASAGFSALIADFAVMPTWEGENTVMALQTARFLVKRLSQLSKARAPAAATPLMPKDALVAMYLAPSAPCASFVAADDAEPSTVTLQRLAERAARLATEEAARALETRSAALGDELAAWNASSVELLAAARAHCALLLVVNFVTAVERFAGSEPIKAVLRELARLNALVHIRGCADALLAAGAVSSGFFSRLKAELVASCSKLRANALPLVDAFALRDSVLRSVIGRADGEVYEHYVARVESSPSRLVDGRPAYWPSLRAFLSRAARQ